MCEVTRNNFEDCYKEIEGLIERSEFAAIDTEFTGLYANDTCKPSLFDDAEALYKKQRKSFSQFIISQFGLSLFVPSPDHPNRYCAYVYNFYLFPHSFGATDCKFLCQASSLEFLCQHNFDFNKFIYHGVPYLNEEQEAAVRIQHKEHTLHNGMQSLQLRDIDAQIISTSCKKIEEWLSSAEIGDQMTLNAHSSVGQYLLLLELQKQSTMNELKYEVENMFKLIITKAEKQSAEKARTQLAQQEERILLSVTGFSRIFKLLVQAQKPLIGHNLFTDLMLVYDKLYKPLPDQYEEYKSEIHRLFPLVYDTKHIAFKIRKHPRLRDCPFLDSTNLEDLQTALESHEAKFFVLHNPLIELSKSSQRYADENRVHEAGYDSYLAGYAFLRTAHLYTAVLQESQVTTPFPFTRYIEALEPHENKVNIGRASIPYVDLAGKRPSLHQTTVVLCDDTRFEANSRTRANSYYRSICITLCLAKRMELIQDGETEGKFQVAKQFIRFGSVDVRILDRHHAIVAVAYHRRVKDVLQLVKKTKRLSVRLYSPLLDSHLMRSVMWYGGMGAALGACISFGILLWKKL